MGLKGDYSGLTTYDVEDIVRWTDKTVYLLRKPCKAGTPCTDTLYWEQVPKWVGRMVNLMLDGVDMAVGGALTGKVANNLTTTASGKVLDARQGKTLKTAIDDVAGDLGELSPNAKTLVLESSTASSTKKFTITVDDDGEITATEVVAEGGGT